MPDPQDSYPRSLLPPGALASSREDVDPAQIGALVAQLVQGGGKKPFTPPRQSSQPPLPPTMPTTVTGLSTTPRYPRQLLPTPPPPAQPLDLPNPEVNQTLWERLSRDPVGAGIEAIRGALVGAGVPGTPGADTQAARAGELAMAALPLVGGAKSLVTGRGLYSRVEDVAAALPERGLHPNKVASLLKSGAAQEEVAYRKLPEFLASKGNNPVTRAEMQAHLSANPAPMPSTTVLGEPRPGPGRYSVVHYGEDALGRATTVQIVNPDGSVRWSNAGTPVSPDNLADLISTWHNAPAGPPSLNRTKYASYSLPGGDAYREHLLQLPTTPDAALQALTDRRDAISSSIAKIDVPIQEHTLPTDPVQIRQWFDGQVAERRRLMDEYQTVSAQIAEHQRQATPRMPYHEGHYGGDYPNVLAHVRTTERNLPAATVPTEAEFAALLERHGIDNAASVAHSEYGDPRSELWRNYLAEHGQGPRGRFLEEVQSDWHQQGKRSGYQTPPSPEQQARLAQLPFERAEADARIALHNRRLQAARNAYLDQLTSSTRAQLANPWQHLEAFGDALHNGPEATTAWRSAREQAVQSEARLTELKAAELQAEQQLNEAVNASNTLRDEHTQLTVPKGVPDAPFKDTWPDLALKQQLLDVARDPHANWLGFTGGKTQAARYDLSKQVSRLTFEPNAPGDYSLGSLVAHDLDGNVAMTERNLEPHQLDDYIGKEPADKLRQEIEKHHQSAEWARQNWTIEPHAESNSGFVIHDPNGEVVHRHNGDVDWFPTAQAAQQHVDQLVQEYAEQSWPHVEGLDLQVGGEGMTHFYDNLLPARLRKLVKPFGGTVEPFDLPASTEGFRIVNQHGESMGRYDSLANAQASLPIAQREYSSYQLHIEPPPTEPSWITRLTPEMKREILRRGFPLLTLPLAAGAASLASRPGANVGTPPPVEPPLAVSHPQPQPRR